jgi:Zn finger protein HypA/HybF involved in hydrogenase expression
MKTTSTEELKCKCQHCDGFLLFDESRAGETVTCPHCQMETILFVPRATVPPVQAAPPIVANRNLQTCNDCGNPVSVNAAACPKCGAPIRQYQVQAAVKTSTIICSYILCFIMPIAGFGAGIYLICKKAHGHGVACIILSIIGGLALLSLLA